ncbi:MAG: cyclic nucleotide-binding domain-containing protein, partial [Deltaproteobacteria bacterium]|nr:cyclic nucleotide-binding domain-containing protein [Deltaproteobacteria bacterium]
MQDLGEQERARLLQRFSRRWNAGDFIFREGEAGSELFILHEGRVRLVKRVRAVERSLLILRPGDLFGENALIEGHVRTCAAAALTDATALVLDVATFESLLRTDANIALRLVR